jgi:hypothetical protein
MVLHLQGLEGGKAHPIDDCISLPDMPSNPLVTRLIAQLSQVKWMRRENGKIQMESKASMASRGIASPDYADALILTFTGMSKAEKWVAFSKVNI